MKNNMLVDNNVTDDVKLHSASSDFHKNVTLYQPFTY